MDTSATNARGTASNPPPGPLQATAPVLEFRCLFTRDVHKRAKKWHDGSLRFHAFNKRVMVYDESNFHIGDTHYRGAEEMTEGLELTLDRPIMVEVGESIGRSETDLNQVVHQRPSPEKPTLKSTARSLIASQSRPKSIKEVLGASQGQIGRARIPYESPYDRRHVLRSSHPAEPPAKRMKVGVGKENVPQTAPARPSSPKRTVSKPQRRLPSPKQTRPSRPVGSTQELVGRVEEVYELSSDDDPVQAVGRQKPVTPQQLRPEHVAAPESKKDARCSPLKPTSAAKKPAKEKSRKKDKLQEHREPRPAANTPTIQPARSAASLGVYTPKPGTTQLQFSREQPRRKLMYRPLLPSSELRGRVTRDAQRPPGTDHEIRRSSIPIRNEQDDEYDVFELASLPHQSPRPAAHGEFEPPKSDEDAATHESPPAPEPAPAENPIDLCSSPLFVPQDEMQIQPSVHPIVESSQEFETRMLEGVRSPGQTADDPIELSPKAPPIPPTTPRNVNFSSTRLVQDSSPSPQSSRSSSPEIVKVCQPEATQERMPPPPLPFPASRPVQRTSPNSPKPTARQAMRRTLSLNDADGEELPDNFPTDTQFGGPSALLSEFPPTAALLNPIRSPIRRTSPRKSQAATTQLRRTFSDPAPMDSRDATDRTVTLKGVNVEEPDAEPGEEETGPWSVKEAWLLFGTDDWPHGTRSHLPAWATAAPAQGTSGRVGSNLVAGSGVTAMGGFGSARGLLERERTAQGTGVLRHEEPMY